MFVKLVFRVFASDCEEVIWAAEAPGDPGVAGKEDVPAYPGVPGVLDIIGKT